MLSDFVGADRSDTDIAVAFIKRHWRGELPLGISVGIVFIGLSLTFYLIQPLLVAPYYDQPLVYLGITLAYVLLTCFIIFPWQLRGALRALDRHFLRFDNHLVLYGVQAIVVSGLILTVSLVIGNAQTLRYYWEKKAFEQSTTTPAYSLILSADGKALQLSGILDFGITKSTVALLAQHPEISAVVLDSVGGQIYEGRGLAHLFQRRALHTYTFGQCISACATAFIGGNQRYLGLGAKLGFHQYAIDQNRQRQATAAYDLQQEQKKDIEFFKSQGIKTSFLNRVFDTPQYSMWYPDSNLLIEAGVVTAVVDTLKIKN